MELATQILSLQELYEQLIVRYLEPDEKLLVAGFILKHSLDDFINQTIERIDKLILTASTTQQINTEEITTIAYSILKRFNHHIKSISEPNEKAVLKTHLSKLLKGILIEVNHKAPQYALLINEAVEHGMQQAVFVESFDRSDFEKYLQIDYTDISNKKISFRHVHEKKEYLNWDVKKGNLGALAHLLMNEYDCIKSQHDFKMLFNNPDHQSKIKWNRSKLDLLLLLFNRFYEEGYIEIKRGKGLWKIISGRFVDFDKNPFPDNLTKKLNKLKSKDSIQSNTSEDLSQIMSAIKVK